MFVNFIGQLSSRWLLHFTSVFFIVFTFQDSKSKTTSTYFVQKEESKVIQTTPSKNEKKRACLQSNKSNTEVQNFTKIMQQNGALPSNKKANEARFLSPTLAHGYPSQSVNNNEVNYLKPPAPACWNGRKKNLFVNGYKCDDGLANTGNNDETVVEDDDLIPPTPSPTGQHGVMNCQAQLRSSSSNKRTVAKIYNQFSATNYYDSEHRETEEVEMDCTALQISDPAMADTDKESFVSDLVSPSCNSLETQSTSRKKYKLSRKRRVLSSPLKSKHMFKSAAGSPKNTKHAVKGTQMADQKGTTPVIAPSKCVVLRSRMKRSAVKGSSPSKKRLQTEMSLPTKVLLVLNTYFIFFLSY